MTSGSTRPKISASSPLPHSSTSAAIARAIARVLPIKSRAARLTRARSPLPLYWLAKIEPPAHNAPNTATTR